MISLLYGEEKYELYQYLETLKKEIPNLELGINYFVVTKENLTELNGLYELIPFFGDRKLVVIKDTGLKFDVFELIEKANNQDVYVVIEDSVDKRLKEYKELSKVAKIKEFIYLDLKEMASYLSTTLKRYGLVLSLTDAQYMVNAIGPDKGNAINELKKLVYYMEKGQNVTTEIIDKVCSKTLTSKVFDLLDLAVNKQGEKAISMLDDLILQKEPVIKIAMMLYKQIKQMYLTKYLIEEKYANPNDILKIHPFVYGKLVKACQKYTKKQLREILEMFSYYDYATKTGEIDFTIGIKQIMCML